MCIRDRYEVLTYENLRCFQVEGLFSDTFGAKVGTKPIDPAPSLDEKKDDLIIPKPWEL